MRVMMKAANPLAGAERAVRGRVLLGVELGVLGSLLRRRLGLAAGVHRRVLLGMLSRVGQVVAALVGGGVLAGGSFVFVGHARAIPAPAAATPRPARPASTPRPRADP